MSQSLSSVLVHAVFSTSERRPWLRDTVRPELYAYLTTVLNGNGHRVVRIGGTEDHVHVALFLSRTASVAQAVEQMKVSTSKWIKTKGTQFGPFSWQKGYGAFSVGFKDCDALVRYIDDQARHHARRDFQAEMRMLFARSGVEFDERYVWD